MLICDGHAAVVKNVFTALVFCIKKFLAGAVHAGTNSLAKFDAALPVAVGRTTVSVQVT